MEIQLNIETIIKDIKSKSHLEAATIADPTARYRVEAGTEKLSEIKRDIADAVSTAVDKCYRFIDSVGVDTADDSISDAATVTFNIEGGPRRVYGKEKALAQKLHAIVVDLALQKYYVSVLQADLSKVHLMQADAGIAELETMLRRKRPPKYLER